MAVRGERPLRERGSKDSRTTLRLLSVLLAVIVLEASAYVAVRILAGGRAAFLFYRPPSLTRAKYEEYLAIRDPELGWPAPRDIDGRRYDASGSRRVPAFPEPGRECVSLYGDSFTYSDEVGDADAWGTCSRPGSGAGSGTSASARTGRIRRCCASSATGRTARR